MAELAPLLASLGPNDNPFAVLTGVALARLQLKDPDWVITVLYVLSGIFGL
jgi:hypothetical protein